MRQSTGCREIQCVTVLPNRTVMLLASRCSYVFSRRTDDEIRSVPVDASISLVDSAEIAKTEHAPRCGYVEQY